MSVSSRGDLGVISGRAQGELAYDEALGRLSLDALPHIDHEHHQVDDLRAADDGADERGMTRAIDLGPGPGPGPGQG